MPNILKTLRYVEIETCSACTRECRWCLFGNDTGYFNGKNEYLETEYITKVLNELKSIQFRGMVSFFSINEPLLDERITSGDLIRRAREILDVSVTLLITTNGDLLTKQLCKNLFASGLDKLVVSCYDDKTINHAYRYHEQYSKIEIQDKRYFNDGKWEYNRAGSVSCNDSRHYQSCLIPYLQSVIGWDGDVRLCCYDVLSKGKLGNIKKDSYLSILTNPEFNQLRKNILNNREFVHPCNLCNVEGSFRNKREEKDRL